MADRPYLTQHLERCIELYGNPIDSEFTSRVNLEVYEQMRADLMICVGIIMALASRREEPPHA